MCNFNENLISKLNDTMARRKEIKRHFGATLYEFRKYFKKVIILCVTCGKNILCFLLIFKQFLINFQQQMSFVPRTRKVVSLL